MDTIEIVDAALAQDKESFMKAFNAAIANKVSDALELKKVELASNLLEPEQTETTVTNEPTEVATEVSGTESSSETTAS